MSDLITEIKKTIGYTSSQAPKCKNCAFSKEVDGVIDRSWDTKCYIAKEIAVLSVDPDARCEKFQLKDKVKG